MRFRGPGRRRRRVGLTPLIDIVFLLLIFFMLATRFGIERAVALDLSAGPLAGGNAVRVEIDASGGFRVEGRAAQDAGLARAIARALDGRSPRRVSVVPEAETSVQRITTALDGAAEAGAEVVGLHRSF